MSKQLSDVKLWAATQEVMEMGHQILCSAPKMALEAASGKMAYSGDHERGSRLLSRQGAVAVASISGPLIPGNPWYAEFMGATGYGEIREALVQAAQDPEVGAIVMDIRSGGGAVSGVTDVADLIQRIDTQVKPVYAYTDGTMASAAYWLGSSARKIGISKAAEVGSIGVLTVHTDISRALDADGITQTVIRSGPYKALGHPSEKLSSLANQVLTDQVQETADVFTEHVAQQRGMPAEKVDTEVGQGRMFMGSKAVEAGLADEVTTFDEFLSKVGQEVDMEQKRSQSVGNLYPKGLKLKTALTDQQIAAMSEGAGFAAPAAAVTAPEAPTAPTAPATHENPPASAAAPSEPAPAASADITQFLQGQLATAQTQVVDLTVQLRDAQASAQRLEGQNAALRGILVASVERLKVAMGMPAVGADTANTEALLAEHNTLRAQFESKFKVGGVAAVAPVAADADKSAQPEDPLRAARLKATRVAR